VDINNKQLQETFGELKADYDMTVPSRYIRRRKGLPSGGSGADYHTRIEQKYYDSIELARDMARNDALIGQLIERATVNEIQEGFTLEPKTDDDAVNKAIAEYWEAWANDPELCDVAGEKTFNDFELEASRAVKRDGDCLIVGLDTGHFQFHEAHLLGTNSQYPSQLDDSREVVLGIELDSVRKRHGYWLSTDFIDPHRTVMRGAFGASETRVAAYTASGLKQAFHIYDPKRVTQTRGVTAMAPIMKMSAMFEDINFAKMVQQQLASAFVLLRQRSQFAGGAMPTNVSYGESSTSVSQTGQIVNEEGIQAGIELTGAPGEDISAFTSNIPNAEYFTQVKLLMQLMGVNFGLPLCLVLMDGSETNFSGWRGAVDEARKGFKLNQRAMIRRLHTPAYKLKLDHFANQDPALGRALEKLKNPCAHEWHPQAWPYIEPVKDANGDLIQVRNGLLSPRRVQAKNGRKWETVAEETIADNVFAIRAAKKAAESINKEFQDDQPVHWRELVNMATPDGTNASLEIIDANSHFSNDTMNKEKDGENV
jgi:lambda family phage portal protein